MVFAAVGGAAAPRLRQSRPDMPQQRHPHVRRAGFLFDRRGGLFLHFPAMGGLRFPFARRLRFAPLRLFLLRFCFRCAEYAC